MNRFVPSEILAALALLLALACVGAARGANAEQVGLACPPGAAPGRVLVGLRPGAGSPRALAGFDVETPAGPAGLAVVRVPAGQECAAAAALAKEPGIAYAEPDWPAHAAESYVPDDPAWSQQWGPAKIGSPQAWGTVRATRGITIAIVDSGIDLGHPDLTLALWANQGEIPGNGLDDDGDGKTDDVRGWHFYHDPWTGTALEDGQVQDDAGHGTHVSGVAAAAGDNGEGIAGVAWGAALLPVKVLDRYGSGWYSDIAAGIVYAADRGARVINLSLGGSNPSAALCAAAEYASNQGSMVVAAAGNDGGPVIYPAACPQVLAIAATDAADRRASFSNTGPEVALAAPGVDIYSTWYAAGTQYSTYRMESGTSMAAPHVAGLAALIWSRWPWLTSAQVTAQMAGTAQDVETAGRDPLTGWGRVDAGRAVSKLGDVWSTYLPIMPR